MFLKQHGLAACPLTKGFSISPVIKQQRKTVSLSLQSFASEHFLPFKHTVLLVMHKKESCFVTICDILWIVPVLN
jgi:hypothetical protein